MKRSPLVLRFVFLIYLFSVNYKERTSQVLARFPVIENEDVSKEGPRLNLYLFFSRRGCPPCLRVIDLLNQPRPGISVVGIIPEDEGGSIEEVRNSLGVEFPVRTVKKWKKFIPNYAPTLFGVGQDGRVYFVLPCVGLEEHYLVEYLDEFEHKAAFLLLPGKR
ncbi:MAG: hypothetical protein QHH43_07875 [Candidatus Saccharicenans sp.]|jgi:hypothetical protein|nr:hypothetical protein [Candidatus Saccharicenans sp.]MDH7575656.1 hypothetical protein [Candidatus Saccharicenans sp.]